MTSRASGSWARRRSWATWLPRRSGPSCGASLPWPSRLASRLSDWSRCYPDSRGECVSATLTILGLLAGAHETEARWEQLEPLLARLTPEEVEELDQRIVLGPDDLSSGGAFTLRRRVVNHLLQRK